MFFHYPLATVTTVTVSTTKIVANNFSLEVTHPLQISYDLA